jgi:hypothetical protein
MLKLGKSMKTSPALLLSFALIGLVRILTWANSPAGNLQPDSYSYLPTSWLDFEKVSFLGNSQRGWLTPLIYALLPTNASRVFFQLTLGFISWCIVLIISGRVIDNKKYQVLTNFFIVFLATSPFILQFETVLISTTYLIYSLLLFISYVVYVVAHQKYSSRNLIVIFLLGWISFSLKSANILIVLALLIYVLFKAREKLKLKALYSLLIFGVVLMGHSVIVGINNDKFWPNSYSGTAILWHLGNQAPTAVDFSGFLKSKGVPTCVIKNAPFINIAEEIAAINSKCPEGNEYIKSKLRNDLFEYLVTNPKGAFNLVSVGVAVAMTSSASHYGSSVSILPESFYGVFFGNVSPDFRILSESSQSAVTLRSDLSEPLWIAIPSAFFVFIGLYLSFKARRHRKINGTLLFVSTLAMFEIFITVLLLPSEWFRQNSQYLLTLYFVSALSIGLNSIDVFKPLSKENEL